MMIENPFESGHIKNYLLLYASVVVIMILFFIASSLLNDVEKVEQRVFQTQSKESQEQKSKQETSQTQEQSSNFKLLDKAY